MQSKYRRNGIQVDTEVREALISRTTLMKGLGLDKNQTKFFNDFQELLEGNEGWKDHESPIEGTTMQVRYQQQQNGKRSIALVRGKCSADCTAEEAAAWFFEYCSRERVARDRENGTPARLEIKQNEGRANEKFFATVKKIPFPYNNRELCFRNVLARNDDGSMSVAAQSIDDEVDYGGGVGKVVRASVNAIFTATNLEDSSGVTQCRMELLLRMDLGGYIPVPLINRKAPSSLLVLQEIQRRFCKDEEVDNDMLGSLRYKMENVQQTYSLEEESLISQTKNFFHECSESRHFTELGNPMDDTKLKLVHLNQNSLSVGVFEAVVDADPATVAAFDYIKNSREKNYRRKQQRRIVEYNVVNINDHAHLIQQVRDFALPGFSKREWRLHCTWRKENSKLWVVYADTDKLDATVPKTKDHVSATALFVCCYEKIENNSGFPQTMARYVAKIDLCGAVPSTIMKQFANKFTVQLREAKIKFDNSKAVDASSRKRIKSNIKGIAITQSMELQTFVIHSFREVKGIQDVSRISSSAQQWVKLEGRGKGWGKSLVTVCAGLEEVAAYFWDTESRIGTSLGRSCEVEESDSQGLFEKVVRRRIKFSSLHSDRECRLRMKLIRLKEDTLVLKITPDRQQSAEKSSWLGNSRLASLLKGGSMRNKPFTSFRSFRSPKTSSETSAIKFIRMNERETRVEIITTLSLGLLTKSLVKETLIKQLDQVTEASFYFNSLQRASEMPKSGGQVVAEELMQRVLKSELQSKEPLVADFISTNRALGELVGKYSFIMPLLVGVVEGKLNRLANVKEKAECLNDKDGLAIGRSLALSLALNLTPAAGVEEWFLQFPSVVEVDRNTIWFRPMMERIAHIQIGNVRWGVKARVAIGAVTSMIDLFTDVYVTTMFWGSEDQLGYFQASLASLLLSICLQLMVVFVQNKKLGTMKILLESTPILMGFKPAIDAFRVSQGEQREAGQTFDALSEMTFMKGIEMFAEAIPGVIIQLMAIATTKVGKEIATEAWLSLFVSIGCTGFISATISYDWDTSPGKRKGLPEFYGLVPPQASKRTVVFFSMVLFSSGALVIRCTTIVLLGLSGGKAYVLFFIGADLCLYLFVKVLRGDFWYFIAAGGYLEVCISLLSRVMVKIITDFTSITQCRHPNEVGGLYWCFGFILTMGSLPVAIWVGENNLDMQSRALTLAWIVMTYSIPITVFGFLVFFSNIEKGYWKTFISFQRGKDLTISKFHNETDDGMKADYVFNTSRHHWVAIEEEVKTWVQANWKVWMNKNPKWFERMRPQIPVEFIPTTEDARKRERARRASVDAEAEGGVGGALRASIRRASQSARENAARVVPIEGEEDT